MNSTQQWNFLKDSYWYVPHTYLPALQMSASDTAPTRLIDQTVWQITDYNYGYFWGNCAVLTYEENSMPEAAPTAFRFVGTIMPEGNVQITFMPLDNQLGAALGTTGSGMMKQQDGVWVFAMQMASGMTDLVVHWAYMQQTKEGDDSWQQLPGTESSVPEFMEAAGF